MNRLIVMNIARFVFLIVLQVMILDNINFLGFVNPYLYVYFILLLPFEIRGWQMLLLAFSIGLIIDAFSNTSGIHAASSVLMAFSRPSVLKMLSSRREYEPGIVPSVSDLGFQWFFSYSLALIAIHHVCLFYMEAFRFSGFFATLRSATFSIIFTLILVIVSEYLLGRSKAR